MFPWPAVPLLACTLRSRVIHNFIDSMVLVVLLSRLNLVLFPLSSSTSMSPRPFGSTVNKPATVVKVCMIRLLHSVYSSSIFISGMVFAVNPPADPSPNSFSAFQALAIATNGTAATTSTAPPAATTTYMTPPPPTWESATAVVSDATHTWTTIYSSYAGTPRQLFL